LRPSKVLCNNRESRGSRHTSQSDPAAGKRGWKAWELNSALRLPLNHWLCVLDRQSNRGRLVGHSEVEVWNEERHSRRVSLNAPGFTLTTAEKWDGRLGADAECRFDRWSHEPSATRNRMASLCPRWWELTWRSSRLRPGQRTRRRFSARFAEFSRGQIQKTTKGTWPASTCEAPIPALINHRKPSRTPAPAPASTPPALPG
jgi:hypothetical protein